MEIHFKACWLTWSFLIRTGIKQVFERARREAPCLVVFEDIDSLITDNNRSFFLNEVDGLEDNDGLLMVCV
jgi:SpoVK/Ycf46/Vps4 family AAA+-type ATPase